MEYNANASNQEYGYLQVNTISSITQYPISDSKISIASLGNPNDIIEEIITNGDGQTETIQLSAPPFEFSMEPTDNQPYSEYIIKISNSEYTEELVSGIQIFSGQTAIQNISLVPSVTNQTNYNPTVIPGHTLWEYYPPKIAENIIKTPEETGEIVLSKVVIPETIVVHDGAPTDSSAKDYYVPFKEYIKNVASCEIYSTWPEATLIANILAILSFTLNRVYTEWYRGKGYNFTITSSTAYDHKWSKGQSIYKNISQIVDQIFANYLSKPNVIQPLLTQYCDGKRVTCPNWMSQWGSKYLGDEGYSAIDILRYYYGSDIYINTSSMISGIPASWPNQNLMIGSSGAKVKQIQQQLRRIAQNYPSIPKIEADGSYGEKTKNAVIAFQKVFNLPQTGIIDYATWYKISQIYVGVSKIAEQI